MGCAWVRNEIQRVCNQCGTIKGYYLVKKRKQCECETNTNTHWVLLWMRMRNEYEYVLRSSLESGRMRNEYEYVLRSPLDPCGVQFQNILVAGQMIFSRYIEICTYKKKKRELRQAQEGKCFDPVLIPEASAERDGALLSKVESG